MAAWGKLLVICGVTMAVIGLLLMLLPGGRLPFRLGQLPGDIVWRGKSSAFYFPVMTSLLLSVVLSVLFWLAGKR